MTGPESLFPVITISFCLIGYASCRNTQTGSIYIQQLCTAFEKMWETHDIMSILRTTTRKVAYNYSSSSLKKEMNNQKQIPSTTSTLTRCLRFTKKADT